MKKLLIATHNKAKFKYFEKLLCIFDLELVSLADLKISKEAPEDGNNEMENAISKARFYAAQSRLVSFSDDAGLYIPALDNEPGVQVRRWGGKFPDSISDQEWLEYFLDRMKDIPDEQRFGKFKIARVIAVPGGEIYQQTWERHIIFGRKPHSKNYEEGWPLSSVYVEKGYNVPWTKMDWQERVKYEGKNLYELEVIFNKIFK